MIMLTLSNILVIIIAIYINAKYLQDDPYEDCLCKDIEHCPLRDYLISAFYLGVCYTCLSSEIKLLVLNNITVFQSIFIVIAILLNCHIIYLHFKCCNPYIFNNEMRFECEYRRNYLFYGILILTILIFKLFIIGI